VLDNIKLDTIYIFTGGSNKNIKRRKKYKKKKKIIIKNFSAKKITYKCKKIEIL